jgi:hypothetical protein
MIAGIESPLDLFLAFLSAHDVSLLARTPAERLDPTRKRLYVLQRATAALMASMFLVRLEVIFYATRYGLAAVDIIGRVRGSAGQGGSYVLFARRWPGQHRRSGVRPIPFGLGPRAVAAVALP